MKAPFIDIHSHNNQHEPHVLRVLNLIVGIDNKAGGLCTAGIHPWHIHSNTSTQWDLLVVLANHEEVIGIGECGLDKRCNTEWNLQRDTFERQIQLANTVHKPLIIHSVRAYQEIVQLLHRTPAKVPVVFHGFNKKIELASSLLGAGYYLSLGNDILSGRHDELIRTIPLDRLFLETDNKTTNIVDIFSYFCAARKISMDSLKQQQVRNLEQVFNYSI